MKSLSRGGLLLAVIAAAACTAESEASFVERCEKMVAGHIPTPATYQRHSVNSDENGNVMILFDAQNEYGALVRSDAACRFTDGQLDIGIVDGEIVRDSLLSLY